MKALKFVSILSILSFLSVSISFGQTTSTKLTNEQKELIAQNLKAFHQVLQLSEVQKTEFESITRKYAKEMQAVKVGDGSKFKKYNKIKSIRKNKNSEMKQLLSKNQYKVYLDKQKEMQKQMKARRK